MPESIVKSVEKQCATGKRPNMCPPEMSCPDCAERVAAAVEAKRSKSQAVAGGTVGAGADAMHLHGLYSQDDLTYEPIDDGNGVWLRVLDHDAKLINTENGRPIQVSQEAMIASMSKWVSPLYPDIQANIDHNLGSIKKQFSREEFDFIETKYEINDGLYVKVQPSDPEIRGALLSKALRPSPEFDIQEYEDVGDVIWPTGLGLMWEGSPVSPGSGAAAPSTIAIGGENVTDDDKDKDTDTDDKNENLTDEEKAAAKVAEEAKVAADAKAVEDAKKVKDELSSEDKLNEEMETLRKEMAEMKDNYEAVLKDNEAQKDREKEHIEKEKAKVAKKLPDGYPVDTTSLDVMRKDLVMHEAQLKAAGKLVAKGPDFVEKDDLLGDVMTDEMYKQASAVEDKMMGASEGFAAASGGLSEFEYNKITGTHYQAPPELETKSKK